MTGRDSSPSTAGSWRAQIVIGVVLAGVAFFMALIPVGVMISVVAAGRRNRV